MTTLPHPEVQYDTVKEPKEKDLGWGVAGGQSPPFIKRGEEGGPLLKRGGETRSSPPGLAIACDSVATPGGEPYTVALTLEVSTTKKKIFITIIWSISLGLPLIRLLLLKIL